ncbi:RNA polymerase sigma factor [Euzebyella saccharophila]|uniref:RNA polymerase sigma factor n=1 Tax=Euzebyella saccharophila TaxID=679664 RepID=A0ABV8JWC7_9FLAO|nr:RNA polymerase sigma-70 factor [Euzebyella saccharophila]
MSKYHNDFQVKQALREGDHKALEYLMDSYHHRLCVYVYSLTHDQDSAKDIVQNVFIKLWEQKDRLMHVESLRSFLYKSVYNGFLNHLRSERRMLTIEEKHMERLYQIIEEDQELVEKQIVLIRTEIQNLPPKCRETFMLSKGEGLTNIEIANFMNVSLKTVENQMSKAFKILRKKLQHKIEPVLFLLFGITDNQSRLKVRQV